jgi:hypothetical protein
MSIHAGSCSCTTHGLPAWTAHLEYQEICGPSPGQALHSDMLLLLQDVPDPSRSVLLHGGLTCVLRVPGFAADG